MCTLWGVGDRQRLIAVTECEPPTLPPPELSRPTHVPKLITSFPTNLTFSKGASKAYLGLGKLYQGRRQLRTVITLPHKVQVDTNSTTPMSL